jgi:hypothetical protein
MNDRAAAEPGTKLRVSGVGAEQGSCGCRLRVDAAHDVSDCGGLFWNALARTGWQALASSHSSPLTMLTLGHRAGVFPAPDISIDTLVAGQFTGLAGWLVISHARVLNVCVVAVRVRGPLKRKLSSVWPTSLGWTVWYVTEGAGPWGTRKGVRAAYLTVLYSLLTNEAC